MPAPVMLALGTAVALSLALAATLATAPHAPWLAPLGLLGGVWAPGFALVSILYPPGRLTHVERHALSVAAGLCLLPLLLLLVSETVGIAPGRVGLALLVATTGFAVLARRHPRGPEEVARSRVPSTRATLALCAAALLLAAGAHAVGTRDAEPLPAALSLGGPLPLRPAIGDEVRVVVEATAGDAPATGALVVRIDGVVVLERELALAPHESARAEVLVPTDARGEVRLVATWLERETHATFHVGA